MKKRREKKLSLSKETLRNLSIRDLDLVAGGGPTVRTACCDPTSSSCTYETCVCPTLASNCC